MKLTANQAKVNKEEKQVERVRRFCLALPETMEKLSHGEVLPAALCWRRRLGRDRTATRER